MPEGIQYDQKSYDLAVYFLAGESVDSRDTRHELAQAIQEAIADWFAKYEDED